MAGSGPQLPFLGLEPTGLAAQRALRVGGGGSRPVDRRILGDVSLFVLCLGFSVRCPGGGGRGNQPLLR